MKQCPVCFHSNLPNATVCRCGALLDQSPMNLTRTCPAGTHVMDPTWTVCAFCKASGLGTEDLRRPAPPPAMRSTLYEGGDQGGSGRTMEMRAISDGFPPKPKGGTAFEGLIPPDMGRGAGGPRKPGPGTEFETPSSRKTVVQNVVQDMPEMSFEDAYQDKFQDRGPAKFADRFADPFQAANRDSGPQKPPDVPRAGERPPARKTEFGIVKPASSPEASPHGARQPGGQRKIVGMLVTYTWKPEGECFPVREGRNWIGRNPDNEVALGCDPTLSGVNSSIVFREGIFMISDKDSMGGTDVNGKTVWPEQVVQLPNYSRIRTGSTLWTFLSIEPMGAN